MSEKITLPKFPVVKPSFHVTLKSKVQQYFKANGIEQSGNWHLYSKAIILVVAFVGLYLHLVFGTGPWWLSLIEAVALGFVVSLIGFNIMHDGNHGSFSPSPFLNKMASYSGSLMGASQYMWSMKHNIIHHTFTNVSGVDDDIDAGDLLRLAPSQEHKSFHRFQHIYFVVLYGLMYMFWIFFSDYKKYFSQKIGDIPLKTMSIGDHIRFWLVKISHATVFIALPIYMLGFMPWLVGFLTMSIVGGFFLSIVFQLAHTVEHTDFPVADIDTNKLENEFALHQLATTANFATKSKVWTWMLGGLNFQIEHHLFPKISHIHYPAISSIIKQTCEEEGVDYIEYKNVRTAVAAHVAFLKRMSFRNENDIAVA